MNKHNQMALTFPACPENESFARVTVAAFAVQLSPTISDLADIKTAVSEAVTNAIVHGYENTTGMVTITASFDDTGVFCVSVKDTGRGIEDIPKAMEPFYTTQPEKERSGMGFCVMQTFMDEVLVTSRVGEGTEVQMKKRITQARL